MKGARKPKPKKWRATLTNSLNYNIPEPETLHTIGIKHWGLDAWEDAFHKILDDLRRR